jgi:hypothetical protein
MDDPRRLTDTGRSAAAATHAATTAAAGMYAVSSVYSRRSACIRAGASAHIAPLSPRAHAATYAATDATANATADTATNGERTRIGIGRLHAPTTERCCEERIIKWIVITTKRSHM